jgi:uncharacterized protein YceH (UPF0502 family)
MQISPVAARILGCLIEKQRTTPDQYPLSLNALLGACNQSTNRSPVVDYDEATVEGGLDELRELELIRREKPLGGRAIKYSQMVTRVLPMGDPEVAVLAVLLLRGPQTPGELKARSERLYALTSLDAVDEALARLVGHDDGPLVEQLTREPGRKEARWRELLSGGVAQVTNGVVADELPLAQRVAALEADVARLAARLDGLADQPRD